MTTAKELNKKISLVRRKKTVKRLQKRVKTLRNCTIMIIDKLEATDRSSKKDIQSLRRLTERCLKKSFPKASSTKIDYMSIIIAPYLATNPGYEALFQKLLKVRRQVNSPKFRDYVYKFYQ